MYTSKPATSDQTRPTPDTIYQTSSTWGMEKCRAPYHNMVSPHTVIVNRSAVVVSPPEVIHLEPQPLPIHTYGYSTVENTRAHWPREEAIRKAIESGETNKRDLQRTNAGFMSRIEQVRFEAAESCHLSGELDNLRARWEYGKETSAIHGMYRMELEEARRRLDHAQYNMEKGRLEISPARLEEYY